MALYDLVLEMLKTDLSAPRVLLDQVSGYITDRYGFSAAELPRFAWEKYPTLEDYEVDLIFSPQFTPADHNRLEYIPILGEKALTPAEICSLKDDLLEAALEVTFRSPDGSAEFTIPVHEVFIDRYVNLLKLDQSLPPNMHEALVSYVPQEARNEVNLLARDEVWHSEPRRDMLIAFLAVFHARQRFSVQKLQFLTSFLRTYRPASLLDLERQFDSLIESCEHDMESVQGRGFHDEYLKAMYAGNERARAGEGDAFDHYRRMSLLASKLKEDVADIPQVAPDIWERACQQQPV